MNKKDLSSPVVFLHKTAIESAMTYNFEQLVNKTLDCLADSMEELDASGEIELEYQSHIITLKFSSGKEIVVNKHSPSQQIWLSSPLSGGLHFSYNENTSNWQIADGRILEDFLAAEVNKLL